MKNLIGRKVRGFKFETDEKIDLHYMLEMNDYIDQVGQIVEKNNHGYKVDFEKDYWTYPTDQIKEHLVYEVPTKEQVIEYYKHAQVIKWEKDEIYNFIDFQDIEKIIYKSESYWNLPSKTLRDADSIGLWNKYSGYAEIITTKQEKEVPTHYDNTNGSIYKFCNDQKLNAWEFDIIKRIVRSRKKGMFKEDLEKTKVLVDLYLKEFDNE